MEIQKKYKQGGLEYHIMHSFVIHFNCALLSSARSEEKRVYGGREHDGVSLEQCDPPTTFTSFIPASGATAATWEPTKGVNETLSR